jgi:hypothetical protein
MNAFPEIIENQVVLMRADVNTGVILDEDLNIAKADSSQIVYTVLNSYDRAVNLAEAIMKENINVEFVIYGPNQEMLKHISPYKK